MEHHQGIPEALRAQVRLPVDHDSAEALQRQLGCTPHHLVLPLTTDPTLGPRDGCRELHTPGAFALIPERYFQMLLALPLGGCSLRVSWGRELAHQETNRS